MTNPALKVIEEIYSIALNPELSYYAQLAPLASNGELGNHNSSMQVLFKLCMIVDQQAKEIQALKEDRVAIANKMVELEVNTAVVPKLDPTAPLG